MEPHGGRRSVSALVMSGLALLVCASWPVLAGEILLKGVELKDCTLARPVNALEPIAPNGAWKQDRAAIVATGGPAPWTIQTVGEAKWTDYELSAKVTIRQPGPKADYRISNCEYDRYLPREMFPPGTHTGQYRYRYYAGEFDWGSEAAVFVRYRDRERCYRVQLSTEYQEIILWHGTGGYLQVVPCPLKAGRAYVLQVLARGANIQVLLDGQKVIDYWHRTLPTLAGKVGLAAYRSTVVFQDVAVTARPAAETGAPPHRPRFRTRRWRTLRWIFDGHEPICLMEKDERPSEHATHRIYYHQVKLLPGYRPYYAGWMGVQPGYQASMTQLLGDENAIKTAGEGTDELVVRFEGEDRDKIVHALTTDRVSFDRVRGTYRHRVTTEVEFLKDRDIGTFEFFDPLTYNNKEPGRGVKNRWLPAGHRWGILHGADGKVYRHPISQTLHLYRQNNWHLQGDNHLWMLYPDRAACPVWEHTIPGETLEMGVCHWGYDWHQRVRYLKRRQFKAGDRMVFRFAMTAYPPAEAEKLFLASTLHPLHEELQSLDKYRPGVRARLAPNHVPDGYSIPICDPAGTDFTRLANIREPAIGWPWRGIYTLDRAVGHNDRFSLRLDGPAEVNGLIYHHMIDPAKRYLCTFWVKTQGISGKGPVFKLKYAYRDTPCDLVQTGLTSDSDWQEVSFVTKVPIITFETYDASSVILTLEGEGQLWLDDFSIRPLADGEKLTDQLPKTTKLTRIPFQKE